MGWPKEAEAGLLRLFIIKILKQHSLKWICRKCHSRVRQGILQVNGHFYLHAYRDGLEFQEMQCKGPHNFWSAHFSAKSNPGKIYKIRMEPAWSNS